MSSFLVEAKSWYRGPAKIEDGFVELDLDQATHVQVRHYDVHMALALTNLRSEADIVEFVGQYGLLASPPGSRDHYREKVGDFLFTATNLAQTLVAGQAVREASDPLNDHAATALDWLREELSDDLAIDARSLRQDREKLLRFWSRHVTNMLNAGMQSIRPAILDAKLSSATDEAGHFTFLFDGPTLRDLAYFRVARLLTEELHVRKCQGCELLFHPTDKRQRFHDAACANRSRQRRHRAAT